MKRKNLKSKVCGKAICKAFFKALASCMSMSVELKSLSNIYDVAFCENN